MSDHRDTQPEPNTQPEPSITNLDQNPAQLKTLRAEERSPDILAVVSGEAYREVPTDLYIPPDAMEVFLETFEGPLDLLLYLIRRQNLDILDIQVSKVTRQYMTYIDLMEALQLELAAEYLLMAALLAEIKSRMLLPRPVIEDEDESDPRMQLIRRLQEYEQLKSAADNLAEIPRMQRDIHPARAESPKIIKQLADPEVDLREVLLALSRVLHRADMQQQHSVLLEPLSVRERMTDVLARIQNSTEFIPFVNLFDEDEGRRGVIVTFLALLELMREFLVEIVQSEPFAPIYLRPATAEAAEESAFLNEDARERVNDGSTEG
jgi:segregation and condensation protein A